MAADASPATKGKAWPIANRREAHLKTPLEELCVRIENVRTPQGLISTNCRIVEMNSFDFIP